MTFLYIPDDKNVKNLNIKKLCCCSHGNVYVTKNLGGGGWDFHVYTTQVCAVVKGMFSSIFSLGF